MISFVLVSRRFLAQIYSIFSSNLLSLVIKPVRLSLHKMFKVSTIYGSKCRAKIMFPVTYLVLYCLVIPILFHKKVREKNGFIMVLNQYVYTLISSRICMTKKIQDQIFVGPFRVIHQQIYLVEIVCILKGEKSAYLTLQIQNWFLNLSVKYVETRIMVFGY